VVVGQAMATQASYGRAMVDLGAPVSPTAASVRGSLWWRVMELNGLAGPVRLSPLRCSDAGGAVDLASTVVALSLLPSMSTVPSLSLSHPFGTQDGGSRGLVPQSVEVACIHGMARGCGSVAM